VTEQSAASIESARRLLTSGRASVSTVLADPSYMAVHPITSFRELIRQHATTPRATIVTPDEPGHRIVVTGTLRDSAGQPAKGALVYVYQTDAKGWYSADAPHVGGMSGDEQHARIFGYLTTGEDGRYEIRTIRPEGYPETALPGHIHIEVFVNGSARLISEILFNDDPRLTPEQRERSIAAKFVISRAAKGQDGAATYTADFVLRER
jgi:protocatechuate 3,4-dioxygenase beta subunit